MRTEWIKTPNATGCVLFFNGWGMDACICAQTPLPTGWDVLVCYDYAGPTLPLDVDAMRTRYDRLVLVAWSMGVWAAGKLLVGRDVTFDHAVAINGTFHPIHANHGIPPAVYQATLDAFSVKTRGTFYRRMCYSPDRLKHFLAVPPTRSVDNQAAELRGIRNAQHTGAGPDPVIGFHDVIIGKLDRIMPSRNQVAFWEGRAACRFLPIPHYPFSDIRWEELLGDAANH